MSNARPLVVAASFIASLLFASSAARAGVPCPPPVSSAEISITQNPIRPLCISSFEPDVVRLTPAGSTALPSSDRVRVDLVVRLCSGGSVPNALVVLSEISGNVNLAQGSNTWMIADAGGRASIELTAASGSGIIAVCADGIEMCRFEVRSPDVAGGATPPTCPLPTGVPSFINGADITNPVCGFLAQFGPATPGINNGWDLNCDGNVNGGDTIGQLGKGGVLQYFGDSGLLGSLNSCALP